MEHWAKLDGEHIARFGELTKREIQVVSYLYLCRNGDNNRCNPSRRTIGQYIDMPSSHLAVAIAGLERKGWIAQVDGGFHLFDAADIPFATKSVANPVENSVEKVTKLVANPVTKSVANRTKSVAESYQIGNSSIYISEQSLNRKELTERAPRKKSAKTKKPAAEKTRIPDPFELTDEMISWFRSNVDRLRLGPIGAHQEFVNYWTDAEGKKALKSNWRRTWEVGMRKLLTWQDRDDAKNGVKPGTRSVSDAGKNEYVPSPEEIAERDRLAALPDCFICNNERWTVKTIDPDARFPWQRETAAPCDACRPDEYAAAIAEYWNMREMDGSKAA